MLGQAVLLNGQGPAGTPTMSPAKSSPSREHQSPESPASRLGYETPRASPAPGTPASFAQAVEPALPDVATMQVDSSLGVCLDCGWALSMESKAKASKRHVKCWNNYKACSEHGLVITLSRNLGCTDIACDMLFSRLSEPQSVDSHMAARFKPLHGAPKIARINHPRPPVCAKGLTRRWAKDLAVKVWWQQKAPEMKQDWFRTHYTIDPVGRELNLQVNVTQGEVSSAGQRISEATLAQALLSCCLGCSPEVCSGVVFNLTWVEECMFYLCVRTLGATCQGHQFSWQFVLSLG